MDRFAELRVRVGARLASARHHRLVRIRQEPRPSAAVDDVDDVADRFAAAADLYRVRLAGLGGPAA